MVARRDFVATAPRGMTQLLADELVGLGAGQVRPLGTGVMFSGSLSLAYRICLWSRLASRVLMPVARFSASTPEMLYEQARELPWDEHLSPESTLAVDCNSVRATISHTHYAALKVKDAIVDQFRVACGVRPSVELVRPDVRINLFLQQDQAIVSLDLAGEGLHRRGYRREGGEAPLKENLAAAILLRAGWPAVAAQGGMLVDPMCGSGTLLIEGALLAGDGAPGLWREYFGFAGWKGHDPQVWRELVGEARERWRAGIKRLPRIVGFDADPQAVAMAQANGAQVGLIDQMQIVQRPLAECRPLNRDRDPSGLVVVNPPYGERLGQEAALVALYELLGAQLKQCFVGWRAAVFTGNPALSRRLRLPEAHSYPFYNGAIECRLICAHIGTNQRTEPAVSAPKPAVRETAAAGGEMFANRLRKNRRTLGRWARQEGIDCFRLYDADMPEYALAIDLYQGERLWVHVQEYQAPASVDAAGAAARLREALAAIPQVLQIPAGQVYFKVRQRQKGTAQYEKLAAKGEFHVVREGPCRLLVNFTDYLDTGLFLDHRPTRALIRQWATGRSFLNLFGYTGTATVQAVAGGATATTTVDMSTTYLDWAQRNLALNGMAGRQHLQVQADCLAWLEERHAERYGLIFLDPPTFSNSKRMQRSFEVQRDHGWLIRKAADLLDRDGVLLFSNNFSRFRMDSKSFDGLAVEEITRSTIARDFARHPRIHHCWRIVRCAR